MTNEEFWKEREYNKDQHRNVLTSIIEIKDTDTKKRFS
jgi:hypothetical protein